MRRASLFKNMSLIGILLLGGSMVFYGDLLAAPASGAPGATPPSPGAPPSIPNNSPTLPHPSFTTPIFIPPTLLTVPDPGEAQIFSPSYGKGLRPISEARDLLKSPKLSKPENNHNNNPSDKDARKKGPRLKSERNREFFDPLEEFKEEIAAKMARIKKLKKGRDLYADYIKKMMMGKKFRIGRKLFSSGSPLDGLKDCWECRAMEIPGSNSGILIFRMPDDPSYVVEGVEVVEVRGGVSCVPPCEPALEVEDDDTVNLDDETKQQFADALERKNQETEEEIEDAERELMLVQLRWEMLKHDRDHAAKHLPYPRRQEGLGVEMPHPFAAGK